MSTDDSRPARSGDDTPPPPSDIEVIEDEPDPRTFRGMFADPGIRTYVFTGLAALAMVFVVMFGIGSDVGAVMLVLIGGPGLVLRWPAGPAFFLLFLLYFLIFPLGYPEVYQDPFAIERGRFAVADILLAASVVVFLASYYRVFSLTYRAFPQETKTVRKAERPPPRPASNIAPGEIARLLYLTIGVMFVGQLVWLFLTAVEIDPLADFPLRVSDRRPYDRLRNTSSGETAYWLTRFVLLAGVLLFGTLLARLVFGYWRLRVMRPAEAEMILQDAGWGETHRERVRQEKWRAWAKTRATEQADDAKTDRRKSR